MAPVVDSSTSVTACSFNSFIDVETIKTDTQKLEALLRIWGDVFFLIGIINYAWSNNLTKPTVVCKTRGF